jgi:uncharacterized membrane protein
MVRKKSPSKTAGQAARRERRLAGIIEQNIHTIADIRKNTANKRSTEERIADAITDFSGRMYFVYFHLAWFTIWIVLNLGLFGLEPFDPFPFGLLTMIVSLEAIFLSAFVLISQNRLSAEADRRADLDLQMNLLAEHELTRALQMLDAIQDKLGIENDSDPELNDLEENVHPQEVLQEIERVQKGINRNIKNSSKNKKS